MAEGFRRDRSTSLIGLQIRAILRAELAVL
jgi:hypothetical protein